jgi:15-cis-phytoene synthase
MDSAITSLTPPNKLALAYARGDSRDVLVLLLAYDSRLAAIISNGKEPLIGQMRLAWWRDVIAKPASSRPTGEPLLAALSTLAPSIAEQVGQAMLQLTDAWGALLAEDIWSAEVLDRHASDKADAVFTHFADVVMPGRYDLQVVQAAGSYWTMATLLEQCRTEPHYDAVSAQLAAMQPVYRMPRALRPLSVLAFAALQDQQSRASNTQNGPWQGLRLIFNALTGR